MNFSLIREIAPLLIDAAWITASLSVLSFALGVVVAIVLTAARLSRLRVFRWFARAYVSVIRGTPFFVQLLILYFATPGIRDLNPFQAGLIAIGINIGAYMSEAIRGAIIAVDKGQNEASRALGFSRFQTMRFVVLPQAAPLMIRSLGVLAVILIKGSSIVSAIGLLELTYRSQQLLGTTNSPLEVFGLAAAFYMVMIYGVMRFVDWLYVRSTRYAQ